MAHPILQPTAFVEGTRFNTNSLAARVDNLLAPNLVSIELSDIGHSEIGRCLDFVMDDGSIFRITRNGADVFISVLEGESNGAH